MILSTPLTALRGLCIMQAYQIYTLRISESLDSHQMQVTTPEAYGESELM